jgi:hypothetical protein
MQDLLVERPGPGWFKSLALRVVWKRVALRGGVSSREHPRPEASRGVTGGRAKWVGRRARMRRTRH